MDQSKLILWLSALADTDEILRQYGCKYFLDSGTLLGAIRDHKFIDWDNDIDIGVVNSSLSQKELKEIGKIFYHKGYNVTVCTDCINLSHVSNNLDLGIKFYKSNGNDYTTSLGRIEGSELAYSLSLSLSDKLIYKNGKSRFKLKSIFAMILNRCAFLIPQFIKKYLSRKANLTSVGIIIPSYLLENVIDYIFYDLNVSVPQDYSLYLEYRYGANWKIPKQNYNYIEEDGGIKK